MNKITPTRLVRQSLAVAFFAFVPLVAQGESLYAVNPPLPQPRPQGPTKAVDATTTASIPPRLAPIPETRDVKPNKAAKLKTGLDALAGQDLDRARAIRDSLPASSLDRHILAWAIALGGGDKVPSGEIAEAARSLAGWPGLVTLRKNKERAIFREGPDAQTVIAAFRDSPPQTPEGTIMLARAYVTRGETDKAQAVLSPLWRSEKLEAKDETAILHEFGKLIPVAAHRIRMEKMLYLNRIASAERVASLAKASELSKAWTAVIRNDKDAGKLLDAVPEAQRSPGWLFARARYLRRAEELSQAVAVMLKAPRDKAALIDPDAWWVERRALSRDLVDAGDIRNAYQIVAAHSAESAANAADAEFHAGWYALRGLNEHDVIAGAVAT
jgi:soluble lytic murein transglycosylase